MPHFDYNLDVVSSIAAREAILLEDSRYYEGAEPTNRLAGLIGVTRRTFGYRVIGLKRMVDDLRAAYKAERDEVARLRGQSHQDVYAREDAASRLFFIIQMMQEGGWVFGGGSLHKLSDRIGDAIFYREDGETKCGVSFRLTTIKARQKDGTYKTMLDPQFLIFIGDIINDPSNVKYGTWEDLKNVSPSRFLEMAHAMRDALAA